MLWGLIPVVTEALVSYCAPGDALELRLSPLLLVGKSWQVKPLLRDTGFVLQQPWMGCGMGKGWNF